VRSRGTDGALSAIPVAVCAPNAFKGTLGARAAAIALGRGVADAGVRPITVPVADGGDGTLAVLLGSRAGSSIARHRVTGPDGSPVSARLGRLGSDTCVVELAEASGLRLLRGSRLDTLRATSRGTGELIRLSLDAGCTRIVVGVGGSASTDGGAGLLQALGARLTDSRGREIGPGGAGVEALAAIDLTSLHPGLAASSVEVACDIRSPLLGPEGAARMFATQKGASPSEVERLEQALGHFAEVAAAAGLGDVAQIPGAGAAGGCGFGLALAGARLVPGAALVCDLVGLDAALKGAGLVITGEGRLDTQTRTGKAPAEVGARARAAGVPCVAICGTVLDPLPDLFASAIALEGLEPGIDPRRHARALLRRAAARVTREAFGGSAQ
jgi:glycerate kinase